MQYVCYMLHNLEKELLSDKIILIVEHFYYSQVSGSHLVYIYKPIFSSSWHATLPVQKYGNIYALSYRFSCAYNQVPCSNQLKLMH
jgi:hypothetical protein